ncbi:hypothetical protein [Rossellomorea aquimaris]|uniref:hypothetical protein n=1 Tax=Rossellomorea aquimaris TaxID=189382 RepID=UPI0016539A3F|nr:hypothetical protein [Rossellomorea aquimaris]
MCDWMAIESSVLVMTGLNDGNTGIDMARDIYRNLPDGRPEKMAEVVKEIE